MFLFLVLVLVLISRMFTLGFSCAVLVLISPGFRVVITLQMFNIFVIFKNNFRLSYSKPRKY